MLISIFLYVFIIFTIILAILNPFWLKIKKGKQVFEIVAEFTKLILPIIALISLFLKLDYNSFWFIVYVSIYYIFDAIYNLLSKISLKDIQGNVFSPDILPQKTKKIMSAYTIMYGLSFHLLLQNTIIEWATQSCFLNTITVLALICFGLLVLMGCSIILFDLYTIIEFPIANKIINNVAINIKILTYKNLYKKLKKIDRFFAYVFQSEIDTLVDLKIIIDILQNKHSEEELNTKISEEDQKYIVKLLSQFQDSYIK